MLPPPVDRWLLPLGDGQACGPDLEYDPESLEIGDASGKAESQFGPAEPPDWPRIRGLCESLFTRTRDLRIALWWARASVNLDGFGALPAVLALLYGLLDQFWDELHPMPDPDEGDALARLSVIGSLDKLNSLLGDIRNARLSDDPRFGGLRVRDVEVALSKLPPRAGEAVRTQAEIVGIAAQAADVSAVLRSQSDAALASLDQLQTLMSERFRADLVVDLATVRGMLTSLVSALPTPVADDAGAVADDAGAVEPGPARSAVPAVRPVGGVHSVDTRQDAIRAIELVCTYLERNEPTNPAQLLLRRAARVIDKNFLQLVGELAPDSIKEVARIMGVDPSTITEQN